MSTGEKIKQLRKQLGMTQEDLGKKIGVQKAAINKYETGIVDDLKCSTITALARALSVSPIVLLDPEDGGLSVDEFKLVKSYRSAEDYAKKIALETLENNQKKTDTAIGQMA